MAVDWLRCRQDTADLIEVFMELDENQIVRLAPVEVESAPSLPRLRATLATGPIQVARRLLRIKTTPTADGEALVTDRRPWPRPSGYLLSLIIFVFIPTIASTIYLIFIASDQYVAEVRFAVRASQFELDKDKLKSAASSIGSGAIPSLASQDAYIIENYIHSRAIIDDMSRNLDLRKIFQRPEADFWARLSDKASIEEFAKYWNAMVLTYVDGPSGIVTVDAKAFRPDDALSLSRAIVDASEKLANEVSARSRNDAMKRAEQEVRRSAEMVQSALLDMRKYRDSVGYIDPITSATSTSALLMQMMAEKIRLESNYFVASRAMSPEAPSVVTLKTQLDSIDSQISQLKSKLTGNSAKEATIATALTKFESLELQRIFAEKLYGLAEDGLERARLTAEQQNIYVSVFVPPALPQEAKYPERLSLSALIPVGLLIVWGIFALMGAAVGDHRY
jgi:capsular polysaccharide transport system permease protein